MDPLRVVTYEKSKGVRVYELTSETAKRFGLSGSLTVLVSGSIQEATTKLTSKSFDAVLLDVFLPREMEALEALIKSFPKTPIIILSSAPYSKDVAREAITLGCMDYLVKQLADSDDIARAVIRGVSNFKGKRNIERLLKKFDGTDE
jgi:response regulator of citrate/malate metabolism